MFSLIFFSRETRVIALVTEETISMITSLNQSRVYHERITPKLSRFLAKRERRLGRLVRPLHLSSFSCFAFSAASCRTCQSAVPSFTSTTCPQERQVYSRQTSPVNVFLSVWSSSPPHLGQVSLRVDLVMRGITFEFRWPRESQQPERMRLDEGHAIAAHLQRFVRQRFTGQCTPMKRSRSCKLCSRLGEASFAWPAAQAEESLRREGPG